LPRDICTENIPGSNGFIAGLEKRLGRSLMLKPKGRPKKRRGIYK